MRVKTTIIMMLTMMMTMMMNKMRMTTNLRVMAIMGKLVERVKTGKRLRK